MHLAKHSLELFMTVLVSKCINYFFGPPQVLHKHVKRSENESPISELKSFLLELDLYSF